MERSDRRVRAPFVVVGLLLVSLGAVAAWSWGRVVGATTTVAVARDDLVAGQRLPDDGVASMFEPAEVAAPGALVTGMVPYGELDELAGSYVRGFLPKGSPVPRGLLAERQEGSGPIVPVEPRTAPSGLRNGQFVEVWTPDDGFPVRAIAARVDSQDGKVTRVNLLLDPADSDQAAAIYTADAEGQIALGFPGGGH